MGILPWFRGVGITWGWMKATCWDGFPSQALGQKRNKKERSEAEAAEELPLPLLTVKGLPGSACTARDKEALLIGTWSLGPEG